jgi:hypothetical protein
MRYHVRQRGKDDVIGPYSAEDIIARVKAGRLARWDMVLADDGQTPEQLKSHADFKWEPLTTVLVAAQGRRVPPPANDQRVVRAIVRAAAKRMMLFGALWCIGGIAVTAITYSMASESPGGGTFVIAWGAILFGFVQFLRGLTAR